MRVVWAPHIDWLKAVGPGSPAAYGFVQNKGRWWRLGWWAKEGHTRPTPAKPEGAPRTQADAEAGARTWPQPWSDGMHLTRVDVCADVVMPRSHPMTIEHRLLFTGRGRRRTEESKHELDGFYIGSRESHGIMLRAYEKTKKCTERDRQMWKQNGWDGTSAVWRFEFEFHRKAIPADLVLPRDTMRLWCDALARIRMCTVPPRTYSQQNKAPTHPMWLALGRPERLTRRRSEKAVTPDEPTQRAVLDALERLCVRAGPTVLPQMMARLLRYQRSSGGVSYGQREAGEGP